MIPTYNNASFIADLLPEVLGYCEDVVVVNDGCTDQTMEILSGFQSIHLVSFPKNRGKGNALKAGFAFRGYHGFGQPACCQ